MEPVLTLAISLLLFCAGLIFGYIAGKSDGEKAVKKIG